MNRYVLRRSANPDNQGPGRPTYYLLNLLYASEGTRSPYFLEGFKHKFFRLGSSVVDFQSFESGLQSSVLSFGALGLCILWLAR